MKTKGILFFTITASLLFLYRTAFALETDFPLIDGLKVEDSSGFAGLVKYFFSLSVVAGAFISVAVIIYSGIIILFSVGNPSKISDAKKRIFGSLLGLFVLGGTYAIIYLINSETLKIEEIKERPPVEDEGKNGVYLINSDGNKLRYTLSEPNLFSDDYGGKVKNVEFIQPEKGIKYGAIFFSDVDYKGQCFFFPPSATSGGTVPFKINSMYIFRTSGENGTPVNVYNNDNSTCKALPETKKAFYPKTKTISNYGVAYILFEDNHWIEGSSINLNDDNLVLLESRDKGKCTEGEICPHCQIITKTSQNETCYPLKYNYTYNPDSIETIKPGYVTLFQLTK
ncbi:MAG: hypothetical protein WCX74_03140 [Candidatus Paceibacterota bacterium]